MAITGFWTEGLVGSPDNMNATLLQYDTFANRPAAAQEGIFFFATDTFRMYRDNGSSWDEVTPNQPIFISALAGWEDTGTLVSGGDYPYVKLADSAITSPHIGGYFPYIPGTVKLLLSPAATGNVRMQFETDFAAAGEVTGANSDSIAYADYAVTFDESEEIDITAAFTGVAIGDRFGLEYFRDGTHVNDTINDFVNVLGLLIEP